MSANSLKAVSKSLSYVLRHKPDSIGVQLEAGGWISVDTLLQAFAENGKCYSHALIEQVVIENDKQRFELSDDGNRIRARQGHSVKIDLGYEATSPPDVLYHGTATRNLDSIFEKGLLKGNRHHVHMSTNRETMIAVGMRYGKPVVLAIDAKKMHLEGREFYVTGNNVWLTEHVPPEYLSLTE